MPPRHAMATNRPARTRSARSATAARYATGSAGTCGSGIGNRTSSGPATSITSAISGTRQRSSSVSSTSRNSTSTPSVAEPCKVEIEIAPVRAGPSVALLAGQERDPDAATALERRSAQVELIHPERAGRGGAHASRLADRPDQRIDQRRHDVTTAHAAAPLDRDPIPAPPCTRQPAGDGRRGVRVGPVGHGAADGVGVVGGAGEGIPGGPERVDDEAAPAPVGPPSKLLERREVRTVPAVMLLVVERARSPRTPTPTPHPAPGRAAALRPRRSRPHRPPGIAGGHA